MKPNQKKPSDINHIGASFRDPNGFLFIQEGRIYRQVNQSYREEYDFMMRSGLYNRLVDARLLLPHQEVPITPPQPDLAYKIIQPEKINFISYPYEWSFSQIKDAALLTLHTQKLSLEAGMSLKDASAYNIQFIHAKPIFIDTLSFERYQEGKPWDAYKQFCQHFLAPLTLASWRDVRLSELLRNHIDGIPLDLASVLLPWSSRFSLPIVLHIHLHAASQKRFAGRKVEYSGKFSRQAMFGLVDSLEDAVRKLTWKPKDTQWGEYYDETNYTPEGMAHKEKLVDEFIQIIQPRSLWDLGANTGRFSRLASQRGVPTIAFDLDPAAVEMAYLECKKDVSSNLLPLLMDLTNPSPSLGWNNRERMSLVARGPVDAILALALIHHLTISNNVPLEHLAKFLVGLGKWLLIEFASKEDSQVQRLLAVRKDIFSGYTKEKFEEIFSKSYDILRCDQIRDSQRWLYLMQRTEK